MNYKTWINSEKRLPKPSRDVLVWHWNNYMKVQYCVPPGEDYASGWYPGGSNIGNTYWMPLPKPPK